MPNIFDLDRELDQIAEALDNLAADPLNPEADEALTKTIEAYFGDKLDERDKKLDNYALFIADRAALAQSRKAEAQRITELAKTAENAAETAKRRLLYYFAANDITKIETPLHKFTVAANGGVLPLAIAPGVDPAQLPKEFQKVTIDIDKDAVRKAIEAGESIPWASLGQRGQSLRIK